MSPRCSQLWLLWLLPLARCVRVTELDTDSLDTRVVTSATELDTDSLDARRVWRHVTTAATELDAVSLDAVGVCGGTPHPETISGFEEPCDNRSVPESLEPVTVTIQDGPYVMPVRRLYICHPGARIRGRLFFDGEVTDIETPEHLERVASQLFNGTLFPMQTAWINDTIVRTSGAWRKVKLEAPKQQLLWVLDTDGNFIVAPEVHDNVLYKHGDLTPGDLPWSRPLGDGGFWRGAARTGGELVFRKNERPLLQPLSSYAALGVRIRGLAQIFEGFRALVPRRFEPGNGPGIWGVLEWGESMPVHGVCAMSRVKRYLRDEVQLPLHGVMIAAAFFDSEEDAWNERVARFEEV